MAARFCEDCGSPAMGAFCQGCGQRHGPAVLPVRPFLVEMLSDLAGVDGRVARTLGPLLAKPGFLTEEFLAGRRSRYVPPLRLYLACSLIYFTVFIASGSGRFFFIYFPAEGMTGLPAGVAAEAATIVRRLPQLMFVALPLFAVLLAGLYLGSRRLYGAHLVFALHFHAFAFLVLPIAAALNPFLVSRVESGTLGVMGGVAATASTLSELWVVVYLYLALRRSYGSSRLAAALKSVLLLVGYIAFLLAVGLAMLPALRAYLWQSL